MKQHQYFHWLYFTKKKRLAFGLTLTLFFWLFLSLAQPFGINSEGLEGFLIMTTWILPMASIWLIIIYVTDYLVALLFKQRHSNNYKADFFLWLVKVFLVVHSIFIFRGIYCNWACLDLLEYGQLWFACILFFLLIYIPFTLYAKFLHVKETFTGSKDENGEEDTFLISDGKRPINIAVKDITHFKSDDNYIDVHHLKPEQTTGAITFRCTMKELEAKVAGYPQFIRVHRSYIINMNFFDSYHSASGNSHVILVAHESETKIPVSRKYKEQLSHLLR